MTTNIIIARKYDSEANCFCCAAVIFVFFATSASGAASPVTCCERAPEPREMGSGIKGPYQSSARDLGRKKTTKELSIGERTHRILQQKFGELQCMCLYFTVFVGCTNYDVVRWSLKFSGSLGLNVTSERDLILQLGAATLTDRLK